ncbi:MAG: hypothetical protein A3K19_20115 [Lentisphaerae bacterium RIFOXYB12_FULL_65_16]|nr:MAG: hypothetical protein A3K18_11195 [Lentisphaerae bacterium RIFOXYA12_64_32]OGV91768.1 MAG: hypothetical protein A3K19_20115 [Lentisphaerae bacterium RIFOXYB12_FULL_65_16]
MSGKRIGFVDNKLDNYHANTYLAILRDQLKDRGYTVTACTAMDEAGGRAWAEAKGVPYFSDHKQMNANVDHYVVLAPSNPELHLELCKWVLPFRKTTYVDKTFAPDVKTARAIFRLADKYGVAVETTSALRYTNVQDEVRSLGGPAAIRHMVTWGPGGSFGEYAIHPLELAISCMGAGAQRLMRRGGEPLSQLLLDFSGGRTAVVNVYVKTSTPFAAAVTTEKETKLITVDGAKIFINTAAAMLNLFDSGKPSIDRQESLMIRRVLDVAGSARALKGFVRL